MKRILLLLALSILLAPQCIIAQPDFESLQQQWINAIHSGEPTAELQLTGRYLIHSRVQNGDPGTMESLLKNGGLRGIKSYTHIRQFKHDEYRFITVGDLDINGDAVFLLTGWRNVKGEWKKEIDVLVLQKSSHNDPGNIAEDALDKERDEWVKRANKHDPAAHVAYSYLPDAIYFSNGRRSDGTDEIAARYSYMENPGYVVDLEKKYLRRLSEDNILEVGRYYAGQREDNPGGLYVILWEKLDNDSWKIALDFNF